MKALAWLRCHLLHRHAVCLLVDGNRYWRYCKDCDGLTSGERAEWEREA